MILKIKAFIYQLTGIYLAEKEAQIYLYSDEGSNLIEELYRSNNDLNYESCISIATGFWQAKHGFTRKMKTRYFNR